jgi:hypothetical protein
MRTAENRPSARSPEEHRAAASADLASCLASRYASFHSVSFAWSIGYVARPLPSYINHKWNARIWLTLSDESAARRLE